MTIQVAGNVNKSVTNYYTLGGGLSASTTEANHQTKAQVPYKASNLEAYVVTNTITAASTYTLRIGAANGNQTISVGSSATGYFEDSTNTDVITPTSELDFQLVTGGTGTSLTHSNIGMLATTSYPPLRMMMGMGM